MIRPASSAILDSVGTTPHLVRSRERDAVYALRFKFKNSPEGNWSDAFGALLADLLLIYTYGFPILHTRVYYPDTADLGGAPPNEFLIEVVDKKALEALYHYLSHCTAVRQQSIRLWDPQEAMEPYQPGMWCYSSHASQLRLFSPALPMDSASP